MNSGSTDAERTTSSTPVSSELSPTGAEPARSPDGDAFDWVLRQAAAGEPQVPGRLDQFLAARTVRSALEAWLGTDQFPPAETLVRRLNRAVAQIDAAVSRQLDRILHAPRFQQLESAWRGVQYLADQADRFPDAAVKIKVLQATWKDLERDFERAVDFDQSQLFRKVYDAEFGAPGGEPYGALIGNYEIHPRPSAEHPYDDVAVLRQIASVAAAAFCPFLTNAHPSMFGLNYFRGMEHQLDHATTMEQAEYIKWRALREQEDARFIGLALPRILMRTPHRDDGSRRDRFRYQEDVSGPDAEKYLWGGAAFAMGSVLIRAFAEAGWLASIRGVVKDTDTGGLVSDLPIEPFATDANGIAPKVSTDLVITPSLEKELSDLGFLPLCACKDEPFAAFYSSQSVQKPKSYDRPAATTNARISAMLQYMFCVSRFAHYVKVLGREKIGSFAEPAEFERYLQQWIINYVTSDAQAPPQVKAKFPLREAQIQVRPQPGKPGSYRCVMQLAPHYELDQIVASVRLVAELTPSATPQ